MPGRMANGVELPPHSPEAEMGVLGCCLLDLGKADAALKAGVTSKWFFEARHQEIFNVLQDLATHGGGDVVLVTIRLRERGLFDSVGGLAYLSELQQFVPSAQNLDYYLPELRRAFERRQVVNAAGRLLMLARDNSVDSAAVLADTRSVLENLHRYAGHNDLPPITPAPEFMKSNIQTPAELIKGVLHQGSKLLLGGSSKSYKTWALSDLAVSVSTGTPWLGFQTQAGKVLYVNLEIQASFFRRRLAELTEAKNLQLTDNLEIWNLRGHAADYRSLLPKIKARIQDDKHALVVLDPTYKLLGTADENSATDISLLLNAVEHLGVTTGAAVAMAAHFGKGNPAAKETIDRISGSGVFARDPDSLIFFTRHEEDRCFTVEMILRNLPPIAPFVVRWNWPLYRRAEELDPADLKQPGGRPSTHHADELLKTLGDQRLSTTEWQEQSAEEHGMGKTCFYRLKKELSSSEKVRQSAVDKKWYQIRTTPETSQSEKDQ